MKTFEYGSLKLFIILFREVKNVKFLREILLKGELECALINVKLIYDPLQIAVAGSKALLTKDYSKLVTKNVYTETLFNLSVSKNITQSLRTFGVNDEDSDMILAHYGDDISLDKVVSKVNGKQVDWNELENIRKLVDINSYYNIKNEESLVSDGLGSVVTRIATKGLY